MEPLTTVVVVDPPVCGAIEMAVTPDPVKAIDWGLPEALSAMTMEPVCVPVALGVKVTAMEQVDWGANEVPHCELAAKGPLAVTEAMAMATEEEFAKVIVFALEVTLTASDPKSRVAGFTLSVGTTAVPMRNTAGIELAAFS